MEKDKKELFDLIVVIINKGFTDLVIDASRKVGAKGGTIFAARGTGNSEIEQFYGIAIQNEKEVVFILTQRSLTDNVMQEIYKTCGLNTNGQGIVFSLPVGRTAGLTVANSFKEINDIQKENNN